MHSAECKAEISAQCIVHSAECKVLIWEFRFLRFGFGGLGFEFGGLGFEFGRLRTEFGLNVSLFDDDSIELGYVSTLLGRVQS